jgi:glycosyltransferase involved in cell wall biosynthesis
MSSANNIMFEKDLNKNKITSASLVTVVTIVLNDKTGLEKTINNVLNQTWQNIEYIIIDGKSDDGSLAVIEKHNEQIDYWISEPDHGIYDAMNKGISAANGQWVVFMNAGDCFYDNEVIEETMMAVPASACIVYGDDEIRYPNGLVGIRKAKPLCELWKGIICSHQSILCRRSLLTNFRFNTKYNIVADFEFLCRVFKQNHEFWNSQRVISSISAGGLSDSHRIRLRWQYYRCVHRMKIQNSFKVFFFYMLQISLEAVKILFKKIFPSKLTKTIQAIKYSKA